MDRLQRKIREVVQQAQAIEGRLSDPAGAPLSADALRAEIDEIMTALIIMDRLAVTLEDRYAPADNFLKQRSQYL